MEVCRKLDNIKLENRPYTEVSSSEFGLDAVKYMWSVRMPRALGHSEFNFLGRWNS